MPMNLLLDTCALLALAEGSLSRTALKLLQKGDDALVSPIVIWEIAIKVKTGKITLPHSPMEWVVKLAERHSLTLEHQGPGAVIFCQAADLPLIHRDPFDRVLVATALARGLTILTADRIIPTYPGVQTAW
jgi:PIN domain nuclease of toxin-antitoxin system